MPNVKNASGYFAADDMDLVDLFIGSEGTLGLVSEIELRLTRLPAHIWGVMVFLPSEAASLPFVRQVRAARIKPVALEFFDSRALALLRRMKASNPAFAEIPVMPEAWNTGIYVEYHDDDESVIENGVDGLSRIFARLGGDEHATWLASDEHGMERLKAFRHHVPEAVNLTIDERRKTEPGITKLGTDLAVPDEHLENVLALYHADLDPTGLDYVMFGHIGNNHIHVNVIPSSMVQYDLGKSLYLGWARHVVAMGGTVSAEHGVGKIKTALLREMYGEAGIDQMRATRHSLDPASLLSPGNLF
jgi:D-lactate dehydrogenase (cytochrome)